VFVVVFLLLLAAAKLLGKKISTSENAPLEKSTNINLTPFRSCRGVACDARDGKNGNQTGRRKRRPYIAAIVLVASCLAAWLTTRIDAISTTAQTAIRLAPDGVNPAPLPETFSEKNGDTWESNPVTITSIEREILPPDTGFASRRYRITLPDLTASNKEVLFSIVLSGRDRTSIHRPELCLLGQGWTITSRSVETLTLANGEKLAVTILHGEIKIITPTTLPFRVPALFVYWFAGSDATVPTYPQMLLHGATDRLFRLRADRWAYFTVLTPAFDDEPAARARLTTVISALWPQIRAPGAPPPPPPPTQN